MCLPTLTNVAIVGTIPKRTIAYIGIPTSDEYAVSVSDAID